MAHTEPIDIANYRDDRDIYRGVGADLRRAREERVYGLDQVASALRIRRKYIEAIEDGRFDQLPGRPYAIGFIRAYATYLGLDGNEMVARYRDQPSDAPGKAELHFPEPSPRQWRPGVWLIALALVLGGGAFGIWDYLQTQEQMPPHLVAENQVTFEDTPRPGSPLTDQSRRDETEIMEAAASVRANEAAGERGLANVTSGGEILEADAPVQGGAVDTPVVHVEPPPSAPPLAASLEREQLRETGTGPDHGLRDERDSGQSFETVSTAPVRDDIAVARTADPEVGDFAVEDSPPDIPLAPPLPPAVTAVGYEPRIYGQGNTDARVVVRAKADSWVQVQGADNDLLLTRILRPGDMFLVPNRRDLLLVTGNAGGIEILLDGNLTPPLGPSGAVRRNISLNPVDLVGDDASPLP